FNRQVVCNSSRICRPHSHRGNCFACKKSHICRKQHDPCALVAAEIHRCPDRKRLTRKLRRVNCQRAVCAALRQQHRHRRRCRRGCCHSPGDIKVRYHKIVVRWSNSLVVGCPEQSHNVCVTQIASVRDVTTTRGENTLIRRVQNEVNSPTPRPRVE